MIFSDFRGPGAHFGDLGAHFEDISDFSDFGDASGAKAYLHFEVKFDQEPTFCSLAFFVFFGVLRFLIFL